MNYPQKEFLGDRCSCGAVSTPTDVSTQPGRSKGVLGHNWSRRLNITFLWLLTIAITLPAILISYLGVGIHPVLTGSMRPTFQIGDLMISGIERASQVKVGDVVLLLSPATKEMQAHRVINMTTIEDSITFITKGDANPSEDTPVTVMSFTMVRHINYLVPKMGQLMRVISNKSLKILAGISFITISILLITKPILRRRRKNRNQVTQL